VSEARRLKRLEEENRRLKRVVADQALNLQVLNELLGKTSDGGAAASCRRACAYGWRPLGAPSLPVGVCAAFHGALLHVARAANG
jgi:hypothetical protein